VTRARQSLSAGEFAGLVAEEGGFDEGADGGLFVGVELVEGGEVVFEVLGESFVVVGEGVDAGGEGVGDAACDVEGGLAGAGFVAAELGDVDADGVGECLLGEAALVACAGEVVGEGHELEHR
jgi:hypothetical protein